MTQYRIEIGVFVLACATSLPACSSRAPTAAAPAAPAAPAGATADAYTAEPVSLDTGTGTLYGTLVLPSEAGPRPVVLIVAGSGPTDRDGNSAALPGPNNSLRLLAEGLARRGVASLRYDKRGIAASAAAGPSEDALRFDTYVDDAAAWLQKLHSDARFASVSIVGHSEGSLIGILATEKATGRAFVSVAGLARRASDVLRDQLRSQLSPELWAQSERILAALESGQQVSDVPSQLAALYRPSVQPYLISWFRYVPADELARLQVPVLIAQGTTDIQVATSEADALFAAKPDAELLLLEGMNHVLKRVPADSAKQQASYSDPLLPVDEALVDAVARFVR